jgi:hypothetical protein
MRCVSTLFELSAVARLLTHRVYRIAFAIFGALLAQVLQSHF